jgi:hypothetical protein
MQFARLRDEMLSKARESALLAVEIYNKPSVKFRSGGYIVLMVIAWTALFHAIFYNRRIKPYYKSKGKFDRIGGVDGDFKLWELDKCARVYFGNDTHNPVELNLGFFIPLRNHFEHRSFPSVDGDIFGECQAMLLNFDDMLGNEFGDNNRIRESLSFSLQMFPTPHGYSEAVRHNPDLTKIVGFIRQYRSMISSDVWSSGKYSFKAFLVQVSNHETVDSLPIQFIHQNQLTEEQRTEMAKVISFTREKVVEIPVVNKGYLRPGMVVKRVMAGLGQPYKKDRFSPTVSNAFTQNVHGWCCSEYNIRPPSGSPDRSRTDKRYCLYDEVHNDYLYTEAWVDYLIEKLSDKAEFERILNLKNDYERYEILPPAE